MIARYFQSLGANSGGTPPPPPTYNPVCLTMSTQSVGLQAFFKVTSVYAVSQDTNVTIQVQTRYDGATQSKTYTITRTILNGNTVSGNAKLLYTSGFADEYFTGIGSMAFSPAIDGGGKTFSNNNIC